MTLATVPTRCRSSGAGSFRSASRCSRLPICRCSRIACCAAAMASGRPRVIGAIMPGNNTVLRTAMMISASAGMATDGLADGGLEDDGAPELPATLSDDIRISLDRFLVDFLDRFGEAEADAALGGEAADRVAAQRQRDAALEPALRQFHAVDPRIAKFRRQHAPS